MHLLPTISVALLCFDLIAASVYGPHIVHEKRDTISQRWLKGIRVSSLKRFPVRIGLTQSNLERAGEYLLDISHPKSPNYGNVWTPQEVITAFEPSAATVQAVREWLASHGIIDVTHSRNKGWLAFDASALQLEKLLKTEYYEHTDRVTGTVVPACEKYHVPASIQEHIDYITPGIRLTAPAKSVLELRAKKGGHDVKRRSKVEHSEQKDLSQELLMALSSNASDLNTCDKVMTPACIAALYHIPRSNVTSPNNSLGIFEAELQYWDQPDLDLFFANFTPWIPNGTHPFDEEINGGVAQTDNISLAGFESMLDLLLAYPIIYPQTVTVLNVDDIHYQTWENDTYTWGFNTLLDAIDGSYCTYSAYNETGDLPNWDPTYPDPVPDGYNGTLQCGVFEPPNVISLSYCGQEADVPIAYQKRQCNEYLKLGLQGVTFVFASGDSGVSNYPEPYGFDGPTGCLGPDQNIFNPTWPNTCPWVTSVGATKVYPGFTVLEPESAVLDFGTFNYSSGGGFSNIYPIPDYQKKAVDIFFQDHEPTYPYYTNLATDAGNYTLPNITELAGDTGGIYNRNGRGIPDVAANGDNIAVFGRGKFGLSAGTSASTPIFAAIINRINDERLAVGKSPVGFINPVLYEHPEVFNDVTNGTNVGCGTDGFSAVPGWDPVTGLGTPNYPKLLDLFLSLP